MLNNEVGTLIRQVLQFLGSMAVTWGVVNEATATAIVGGLTSIAVALWAVYSRSTTEAKKIALVEKVAELKVENTQLSNKVDSSSISPSGPYA